MRRPSRIGEKLVELALGAAALVSVAAVALIFAFVLREAAPLLVDPGAIAALFRPSGADGSFTWQPIGRQPRLDVVPLAVGSLKITSLAIALAAPVAIGGAVATAEILGPRARRLVAPAVELLAGVPSVVVGLVVLLTYAPPLQSLTRTTYATNALVAALALFFPVAPVIYSVTLDGLLAVPRELREASYALGATRRQTALRVMLPAALPSLLAALTLGFGRAVGETMIVLMTSGNAAVSDASPVSGARTVTATIAAELGETERHSEHWRVLFLLGFLLVAFTFVLDHAGRAVARAASARRQGPAGAPTVRHPRAAEAA